MKGVIVQVGEPKSIILFNNGKIRAIPTPADCHVGMVVTLKLNNKLKIMGIALAAVLLVGVGVLIGTIFREDDALIPVSALPEVTGYESQSGSGHMMMRRGRQTYSVTVQEAVNLPDDTVVVLTGRIVESLGDGKYIFRDSTGDITVEIDRKLWRDFSAGTSDLVEISGEVDVERRQVVIDVKSIRKL